MTPGVEIPIPISVPRPCGLCYRMVADDELVSGAVCVKGGKR